MNVLKKNLFEMTKLTEQALRYSYSLFCDNRNEQLVAARNVERRINETEINIDAAALDYCALPLRSDEFRVLLKSAKISVDLEQIGNHALWLSEFTCARTTEIPARLFTDILAVHEKVIQTMSAVSLVLPTAHGITSVPPSARELTKDYEDIVNALLKIATASSGRAGLPSDVFLICRALDRIADLLHAIVHESVVNYESLPVNSESLGAYAHHIS